MKKRLLTFLLSVSMLTSVFGLAACSNAAGTDNEPPKEGVTASVDNSDDAIKNLQQQIADLQAELKKLLTEIESLKTDNESLSANVDKMETEIKNLSERLDELEQKSYGQFYTLKEAYDKNLLTQADLISIAYYHNSLTYSGSTGRYGNEDIMSEDYIPDPKTPEVLDSETETAIIQTFWYKYIKGSNLSDKSIENIGIGKEDYYGTYNNCVAVMVWRRGLYSDVLSDVYVGGVCFHYTNSNAILIWVSK